MKEVVTIALDTVRLDRMQEELAKKAGDILDKIAFDVESDAKPRTAIDTGAMRSSGYVSGASRGGSSYDRGVSEAESLRPGVDIIEEITPNSKWERVVGFSVGYSFWQELSHPFLVPAVENQRGKAVEMWRALLR